MLLLREAKLAVMNQKKVIPTSGQQDDGADVGTADAPLTWGDTVANTVQVLLNYGVDGVPSIG